MTSSKFAVMEYRHRKLKEARLLKGLYKTELAQRAELSIQAVSLIERGKGPWLKAIEKICLVLGLELSDVIVVRSDRPRSAVRRKTA